MSPSAPWRNRSRCWQSMGDDLRTLATVGRRRRWLYRSFLSCVWGRGRRCRWGWRGCSCSLDVLGVPRCRGCTLWRLHNTPSRPRAPRVRAGGPCTQNAPLCSMHLYHGTSSRRSLRPAGGASLAVASSSQRPTRRDPAHLAPQLLLPRGPRVELLAPLLQHPVWLAELVRAHDDAYFVESVATVDNFPAPSLRSGP